MPKYYGKTFEIISSAGTKYTGILETIDEEMLEFVFSNVVVGNGSEMQRYESVRFGRKDIVEMYMQQQDSECNIPKNGGDPESERPPVFVFQEKERPKSFYTKSYRSQDRPQNNALDSMAFLPSSKKLLDRDQKTGGYSKTASFFDTINYTPARVAKNTRNNKTQEERN